MLSNKAAYVFSREVEKGNEQALKKDGFDRDLEN